MLVKIFQRMVLCMLVAAVVFCSILSPVAVGATEAEAEAETETQVTQQTPIIDIIKSQSGYIPEELYNTDLYEGELVGCDLRDYVILPMISANDAYSFMELISRKARVFVVFKDNEFFHVGIDDLGRVRRFEYSVPTDAVQDIVDSKIYESALHSEDNTYRNVLLFFSPHVTDSPGGEAVFYIGDKETIVLNYEHVYYYNSSEVTLLRGEYRVEDFIYYRDLMQDYMRAKSLDDKGHPQYSSMRFDDFVKQMQSGELTEKEIAELERSHRRNYRLYYFLTEYHDTVVSITCAIIAVVVVSVGAVVTVMIVKRRKKRAEML